MLEVIGECNVDTCPQSCFAGCEFFGSPPCVVLLAGSDHFDEVFELSLVFMLWVEWQFV